MGKKIMAAAVLTLLIFSHLVFADEAQKTSGAEGGYWNNLWKDYVRGVENLIGAPIEIPIAIQEYHEKTGRPVIRHMAGFVHGCFKAVARAGSGLWDFVAGWIPGQQEGVPVNPETLF